MEWVAKAKPGDDAAEIAAEQLGYMGADVCPHIHAAWSQATPVGRELFLDILRKIPGDDKTLALLIEALEKQAEKRALYASFLGAYGDERALPFLQAKLQEPDLDYLAYVELVQAIEALGGTPKHTRSFDGDDDYEALRNL